MIKGKLILLAGIEERLSYLNSNQKINVLFNSS